MNQYKYEENNNFIQKLNLIKIFFTFPLTQIIIQNKTIT